MTTQPLRVVEENLRAAMGCYRHASADGETRSYPNLVVTSCGQNLAVFNSALLTDPVSRDQLEQSVLQASTHFAARKLGWSFWLCDDLAPAREPLSIHQLMHREGLVRVAHAPGMYTEHVEPPESMPEGVEFRVIDSAQGRLEFAHVSSIVFALGYPSAVRIYGQEDLWTGPMRGWIAYVRHRPVAIVTVVVAAGAAGVYSLGTLPQYRKRGYGRALLWHALEETRKATGITRSVLQSTEEGLRMYSKMGYRTVTRFSVFTKEVAVERA